MPPQPTRRPGRTQSQPRVLLYVMSPPGQCLTESLESLKAFKAVPSLVFGTPTPPPPALCSGFPCDSAGKESTCSEGDLGSIPGLGRSPEKGKAPLQYSALENITDSIVHGVAKSQTRLGHFHSFCPAFSLSPF